VSKDSDIIRAAEQVADPLAEARRVVDGKYCPLDTAEGARELLRAVEQLERAEQELKWTEKAAARDKRSTESRAAKHRARAIEIDRIRQKLATSMDGHLRSAADLVDGQLNQRMSDDAWQRFRR